jgi:regulator of sirC expression with transglutaminase-like and TPR domain
MFEPLSPLSYFRLLVAEAGSGDDIALFEAAASLAQDAHPDLDLQTTLDAFDRLAADLADACRGADTELARLQRALNFFYRVRSFAGNADDYYDPDNSYLHRVLATRRGIPISLAVLFAELARHVGLEVEGIAFPSHFLLRANLHEGVVIIDPFSGRSLDREALERRATPYGLPLERLLQPASPRQILVRMLNNLSAIHAQQGRRDLIDKVAQRLRVLGVSDAA